MRRSQGKLSLLSDLTRVRALVLSPRVHVVSVIRRSSFCLHCLYTRTLLTVMRTEVSQCLTLLLGSIPWYQEPPTQLCSGGPRPDTHLYQAT